MTVERWAKVKMVFNAALERGEDERRAFVMSECGSDDELRGEVESLLTEHSTQPPLESPVHAHDLAGHEISHYRILERVGQGGMGVVYKAEDLRLNRLVALKFLAPDADFSHEERVRFEQEAKSLAAIDHPNICPLHEIEESQGQLFFAMSFVEGPTLKDKILDGPLDVDEAVQILIGAAEGLQAAHNMGLLHRDIKSANIMLTSEGRPLITDFGIALPEAQASPTQAASIGTPAYMSPEQIRGDRIDRRSDIWSLGVVLYEAVTGTMPFGAHHRPTAILTDEPRRLAAIRPGLPAGLDRIVRKALAKKPADRYQSAAEMAADLRALPLGKKRAAQRVSLPALVLASLGALIVAVALAVILRGYIHPSEMSRISLAVLPLENLSGDPEQQYFTEGMTEAITTDLARIGGLRVLSRSTSVAFGRRPDPLRAIAQELRISNVVEGSVLRVGNSVRISVRLIDTESNRHLWAQNYEGELRDILLLQSSVAQAIAQEIKVRMTAGEQAELASKARVNPNAYEAFLKGRHLLLKWQRDDIRKGREYFQQAIANDPAYAPAYLGIADSYITEGFYWGARPRDVVREAERYARQALQLDPRFSAPHRVLALAEGVYKKNWPDAKRQFELAAELDQRSEWSHYNYAAYYLLPGGRLDEALNEIRSARDIAPVSANITTMVGWIHFFRREYDPAINQFRQTLELEPTFLYALMGLRVSLGQRQHLKEALALGGHPETDAWLHARLGNVPEARRILEEMIERSKREYIGGYEIAHVHTALGETRLALEQLERAYQEWQPQLANLNVDPRFDSLRSDPRFIALVRKMNLDH